MPRNTSRLEAVATIGIDIGKNTFHLVGLDRNGAIVLRPKLSRRQVEARLANMPACLIGMEACVGAATQDAVVQSNKVELVINAQTATMLGLTVPEKLLVAADEVIE